MPHHPIPARIRSRQRSALIMLVLAGTLNYLDRSTLSIANPLIRHELGLSIADMGLLLSAFLWAYAFSLPPGSSPASGNSASPGFSSAWGKHQCSPPPCGSYATGTAYATAGCRPASG